MAFENPIFISSSIAFISLFVGVILQFIRLGKIIRDSAIETAKKDTIVMQKLEHIEKWIERHEKTDLLEHKELLDKMNEVNNKIDTLTKELATIKTDVSVLKTEIEYVHKNLDKRTTAARRRTQKT